jgi:GT2 family glycosyltransferase
VDLSVIIVSWNTKELLRDCLESVPAACAGLEYEVFVVDNDSTDGTPEMVADRFPEHQLVPAGANLGFAKANNLALKKAGGKYLLLLNPDTVATPDAFVRLIAFAATRPHLAAVSPLLTDDQGKPTITYGFFPTPRFHWLGFIDPLRWLRHFGLQQRVVHVPERNEPSCTVDYIAGACFMIPRPALDEVGLLDERYFLYFEETDWCLRAHALGREIWYCAEAEIVHLEGRAAANASLFSIRQFQKSYRQFVAKNYGAGKVWRYRLAQFAEYTMKALLRSLALGNREENQMLAAVYRERARLQLISDLKVEPPR